MGSDQEPNKRFAGGLSVGAIMAASKLAKGLRESFYGRKGSFANRTQLAPFDHDAIVVDTTAWCFAILLTDYFHAKDDEEQPAENDEDGEETTYERCLIETTTYAEVLLQQYAGTKRVPERTLFRRAAVYSVRGQDAFIRVLGTILKGSDPDLGDEVFLISPLAVEVMLFTSHVVAALEKSAKTLFASEVQSHAAGPSALAD